MLNAENESIFSRHFLRLTDRMSPFTGVNPNGDDLTFNGTSV